MNKAIIVDIDGTVALMQGRSAYDNSRVGEDIPNKPIVEIITILSKYYKIIFLSGRTEDCRETTELWLKKNLADIQYEALYMRKTGDFRKDSIIKLELFNKNIADKYNVVAIFDDRNQVVNMWRHNGLTCLQVAEGNF